MFGNLFGLSITQYCITFDIMKQLTIMEYINYFSIDLSRQGVLWRINKHIQLDHVIKIERIGHSYILTVQ